MPRRWMEVGMAGIAITRQELTASDLRSAAGRTKDARAARRMLAIALVLEGVDRATAAQTCGMDRQTLRDWVHRYNAEGLCGLVNRTVPHRPRRLAPAAGHGSTGRACGLGRSRPRSDAGRGGALAAEGLAAPHRCGIRRRPARAQRRQAIGGTRVPAAVGPPAAPGVGPGGARGVQKNFPEAVEAAIPPQARDKPLEIWFQE